MGCRHHDLWEELPVRLKNVFVVLKAGASCSAPSSPGPTLLLMRSISR
jgi:hypothetical protein